MFAPILGRSTVTEQGQIRHELALLFITNITWTFSEPVVFTQIIYSGTQ